MENKFGLNCKNNINLSGFFLLQLYLYLLHKFSFSKVIEFEIYFFMISKLKKNIMYRKIPLIKRKVQN